MFCKACIKYADDRTSSFVTGSNVFRTQSLQSQGTSSQHESCAKKLLISKKKESREKVTCTYTGEVQASTSTGAHACRSNQPDCPDVVGRLDIAVRKLNKKQREKLSVCFNTEYWVVKNEMPFTVYPSLLDLQQVNGVRLAKSFKSDQACRR